VLAKSLAVVCLLAAGASSYALAGARDWTGSGACGSCHPRELAAWQTTRHALTRDRFPAKPQARCLACHGTGEAPAGPAIAVEVGCESCHGAGAGYATDDLMRNPVAAHALGLTDVSTPKARTALCMQCHSRMTTSRTFDPNAPIHPVKKS
jgi:hypothetical protein